MAIIIIIIPTIIKEDSSLFPSNQHTRATSVSNRKNGCMISSWEKSLRLFSKTASS
jgi:hypothetical protein